MFPVTMKITGAKEIADALRKLPEKMDRKVLEDGLLTGARLIRDDAKARAPLLQVPDARRVRGALRKAIQAIRARPEGFAAQVVVKVRRLTGRQIANFKRKTGKGSAANPNDVFYASFIEFGTSKMAARPYLRPAFQSMKEKAVAAAIARFRERIQAEVVKLGRTSRL
jgi:HK97 gp10 family phage protein